MRSSTILNYDVILEICEYISLGFNDRRRRQYLRSLALVSTAFCEPALNLLWRDLGSLLPLIQLLSISQHDGEICEDILDQFDYEDASQELACVFWLLDSPISDAQWERVQFYAHRVRTFSYHPEYPAIHPSIIYAMAHRALPDAILPGLHSLQTTTMYLYCADIICFIAASLKHISFDYPDSWRQSTCTIFHRRDDVIERHFLAAVNARAPYIQRIETDQQHFREALEDLGLFRYAQSIQLDELLGHRELSQVASLPNLNVLEFRLEEIEHPAPVVDPGFLLLEELTVRIEQQDIWHAVHSLITGITSPRLKKMKVENGLCYRSYFEPCGCKPPLPRLLRRWESSMRELDFRIEHYRISHSPSFLTDYISPFLELSNLRIVNIRIESPTPLNISFSGRELINFADTWPQLEKLFIAFGPSYRHHLSDVAATPSINCVARFALKLPKLTHLDLPCARLRQENLWADVPPSAQHGLKELFSWHVCHVEDKTIVAPVADFLKSVFPSVKIYGVLRNALVHE